MAHLALRLFGAFDVSLDGQPVCSFKSDKVRALLAYLAVEANRPHRRELLAGLLWPGRSDRDALSNLRYALYDLRKVIGDQRVEPPFLLITHSDIRFNTASDHWLDVGAFRQELAAAAACSASGADAGQAGVDRLRDAVALYRGRFLAGFSVRDSTEFEGWVLLERERLKRQVMEALHRLAACLERCGEYGQAQTFARRQIELEPWREQAHRQLMRLLALGGERSAALVQYEACRHLLADELGIQPSPETTALYEEIRGAGLAGGRI
jgi:DNA-binding SARP family transcriptional activator